MRKNRRLGVQYSDTAKRIQAPDWWFRAKPGSRQDQIRQEKQQAEETLQEVLPWTGYPAISEEA